MWVAESLQALGLAYYTPYARMAYGAPRPWPAMPGCCKYICTFAFSAHFLSGLITFFPQFKRVGQLNFPAIDTCYTFFLQHLRNITCTSFLSFLVSSALASQALDDEAPRWLNAFAHCQTAVAYNKMQLLDLSHQGLPRSKLSPHFHQNCTHGALQSPCTVQCFVSFSLTA